MREQAIRMVDGSTGDERTGNKDDGRQDRR
jgi:hypothetical protein